METNKHGFRRGAVLAAVSAMLVAVAGCSGGVSAGEDGAAAPAVRSEGQSAVSDAVGVMDGAERAEADSAERAEGDTERIEIAREQREIIYTADMTVRVKDVPSAAEKAKRIVEASDGYLSREASGSYGDGDGSAELTFKVPPAAYPRVIARLGTELGVRESLHQSTEDVTEAVADVNSRVESAKAALKSLRSLLEKADTIGEVLQVEREINKRETELESLQARQKALAAQVAMATLTLRLVGPAAPPSPAERPAGFLDGLAAGWSALAGTGRVALLVLGTLLPWLVVIVPLVWLIVRSARRFRRGRTVSPAGQGGDPAAAPPAVARAESAGAAPGAPPEGEAGPQPAVPASGRGSDGSDR